MSDDRVFALSHACEHLVSRELALFKTLRKNTPFHGGVSGSMAG